MLNIVNACAINSESFTQWFFQCLEKCKPHEDSYLAMILWSIWKSRNEKLWNNVDNTVDVNICLAADLLQQWLATRSDIDAHNNATNAANEVVKWERPPSNFMKCNVDAAIFKEMRLIAGAAVIRDYNGEFMMCRLNKYQGLFEVRESEAKALLDALLWAVSMELKYIIFETDSKSVVDAIHSNRLDHSEFGTLIKDCCSILFKKLNFEVRFVRRQANVIAHTIARAANSYASPCVFYDAPSFISNVQAKDCNDFNPVS